MSQHKTVFIDATTGRPLDDTPPPPEAPSASTLGVCKMPMTPPQPQPQNNAPSDEAIYYNPAPDDPNARKRYNKQFLMQFQKQYQ